MPPVTDRRQTTSSRTCELSGGIGDGDLDWKASWEMKPESWEETEERRAGVCWGSTEEEEEEEAR